METISATANKKMQNEKMETESCCGSCGTAHPKKSASNWNLYLPTCASLVLLLFAMGFNYYKTSWFSGYLELGWFVLAYFPVGGKVLWHAVKNSAKGQVFNEFSLMGIATLGAFFIGEYAEAVAVMLFYVIGEHFQDAAVQKSRKSIKGLIDDRPGRVQLVRNGKLENIAPENVAIGEIIRIKPGEKVALDGLMLSEKSAFNTAALTGESKPDTKYKGEQVLAGMVNLDRVVELQVSKKFVDSTLSKILQMVEEAASRKARPQKFITRFAKVYTPIVFFGAVALTFLPFLWMENYVFDEWLYRALVFLVVSCPCALVVSIPLGYFGGIGAASKNGILFKGANYLDLITKIDTVAFDKTGTLTKGIFNVQHVETWENYDKQELVKITGALENHSTHPIAKAISEYANKETGFENPIMEHVEELSGLGLKGKMDGKEVLAGNTKLLQKHQIPYPSKLDELVETLVLVSVEGRYAGYFSIADELKEDASQTIKSLNQLGIKKTAMLSGDKEPVVVSTAEKLGLEQAFGGLLPQDKIRKVEILKKNSKNLAFLGDGINDAPVIALADIGIAMGGLGSDAAIETADVVIQNDEPSKLIAAMQIGKRTKQVVWQNIGLAFGVKALILILAVFGFASLWGAVFADVGVALLAILNAFRIQWMDYFKELGIDDQ